MDCCGFRTENTASFYPDQRNDGFQMGATSIPDDALPAMRGNFVEAPREEDSRWRSMGSNPSYGSLCPVAHLALAGHPGALPPTPRGISGQMKKRARKIRSARATSDEEGEGGRSSLKSP